MLYFDHNATTPLDPAAALAIQQALAAGYANPASQHAPGRQARAVLEDARERIGACLGAQLNHFRPDRVLLTSGGTEANNLAIFGLAEAKNSAHPPRIIVSPVEHPCILAAAADLARRGFVVEKPRVTRFGVVEPGELKRLLADQGARLVSIQAANHETGVLQPIEQLASLCREHGVPLHVDAVQVAGKSRLQLDALNVDAMTISAHKFNGPPGVGALVVRHGVELAPRQFGGFQQEGLRPGTESIVLALGMLAALEAWERERIPRNRQIDQANARLEGDLETSDVPTVIHGSARLGEVRRNPTTTNVGFPGLDRQALFLALDLAGVACSTGSACASGSSEPSPVLTAMGVEKGLVASSLRFSVGHATTVEEAEECARRIIKCCKALQPGKMQKNGASGARDAR